LTGGGALAYAGGMANPKHMKLDDGASTTQRAVFQITGKLGDDFAENFWRALESNQSLAALRPELKGSKLMIDLVTHIPGVVDAFDKIVGGAKGASERADSVENEKQAIDRQAKNEALKRFKESQGLSG
jgi:hypothetical protein